MDGGLGGLLCAAAHIGDLSEVRRLVARGADVDSRDPRPGHEGQTTLHLAVSHHPTFEFLLQNGASASLSDQRGYLPLHIAAMRHADTLELLLAAPDIDVNARSRFGLTPLLCALDKIGPTNGKRAVSCLNLLIEAGADVDAVTDTRWSALDIALASTNTSGKAVKLLLRAGANPATEMLWPERKPYNAAAFAVYDRVKAAGDWKAYARKHQRVLAGLVSKCAPLPDDAARLVVGFWTPPGGSYMC